MNLHKNNGYYKVKDVLMDLPEKLPYQLRSDLYIVKDVWKYQRLKIKRQFVLQTINQYDFVYQVFKGIRIKF